MITVRRNNIVRFLPWILILITLLVLIGCGNPFVRPEARDDLALSLVLGSSSEGGSRGIFTDADFAGKTLRVVLFQNNNGSPGMEIARSNSVIQSKNGNLVAEVSFPNTPMNSSVILRGQIIDGGLVYFQGFSQPFVPSSTAVNLALNETVFNKLEYWFTFEDLEDGNFSSISEVPNNGKKQINYRLQSSNSKAQIQSFGEITFLDHSNPTPVPFSVEIAPISKNRFVLIPQGGSIKLSDSITGTPLTLTGNSTFSFWIFVGYVDFSTSQTIFSMIDTNNNVFFSSIISEDPADPEDLVLNFSANLTLTNNYSLNGSVDPSSLNEDNWNMITFTLTDQQPNSMNLYINGNLISSVNINEVIPSINEILALNLGFDDEEINQGAFDDIRIYSQAMTASQVLALYNATKPQ